MKTILAKDFCHKEDFSYCAYTHEYARSFRMDKKIVSTTGGLRLFFFAWKNSILLLFHLKQMALLKEFIRRTIV